MLKDKLEAIRAMAKSRLPEDAQALMQRDRSLPLPARFVIDGGGVARA